MAKIDPEQERKRLAEFYSHLMDGELEKVARQAYELTDIAREALRAELAKRSLAASLVEQAPVVPVSPPSPGDPPPQPVPVDSAPGVELEFRDMVTIRQFRDLPEALFAKGSLESAGIECGLIDDNMVRLDWFISNLLGGVKLQVRREDAAIAQEILEQPIPENLDVSGVGEYEQPRCPKCQSLDINFQEVAPSAYFSAALNVPIPFHRRAWRCHSCDAEWEDDGLPAETESPT
ncbi:MAG TPA: hypothetical protein VFE61_04425 [Candidatus Sulfotelmatobacter sp.]|jgi:hypothetical protein|nr:hypothetical protein [Candidatus Sulfotelmatobacter sp.]